MSLPTTLSIVLRNTYNALKHTTEFKLLWGLLLLWITPSREVTVFVERARGHGIPLAWFGGPASGFASSLRHWTYLGPLRAPSVESATECAME